MGGGAASGGRASSPKALSPKAGVVVLRGPPWRQCRESLGPGRGRELVPLQTAPILEASEVSTKSAQVGLGKAADRLGWMEGVCVIKHTAHCPPADLGG